ncbi:MAG TPA: FAD-binding and (Fe-S)-binding domain-containing protein [Nocardioidaceae bacterium]|nr:FAD-binding and (Fe-S)-binding domain-containing protein [Nocardioidaceae bacterium]
MSDLAQALRRAGIDDVDDSSLSRAMYATDASLYRVVPAVVVRPRDVDQLVATVAVARESGTPLTMRGAGTSIAGNAVGTGIVVDTARHLDRVLAVDVDARSATVQPGTVHATLQRAAAPHRLRFGPDPSTHTRCTVGGMIGNNACGSRALGYGRTSDNVLGLDVLTGTGERLGLGAHSPSSPLTDRLGALVDAHLGTVRTELGRFPRQVSGYGLEHLLPENGRDVARFLVGSEGTLGVVLGATVRLVEDAPHRALAVLGYPTMFDAADAVPALLTHPLVACEGLDSRIVDVVRSHSSRSAVPDLPRGAGWLFAEVTGGTAREAEAAAAAVARGAGALEARLVTAPEETAALWRIREDGAGLAARTLPRQAQSGWEDAAVPPDRLGDYLRGFDGLLKDAGLDGVPYGHFGDGCVHVRIDFPLRDEGGRRGFRAFLEAAADLTAAHGGSLSGEHGDGRARSELLTRMYSREALALFAGVKHLFDPEGLLNPGVLVSPRPVDADLRLAARLREPRHRLRLVHDGGSVVEAVHRCTGVGKCIADNTGTGGVMCPSYLATRNEKDSTRGRSRVLQEMVNGSPDSPVTDGWRSQEVHDALDLCLSCKGCASDCPTGIDMATYKAEALHQRYRRRLRPRSHYALGQLPRWARLSQPAAPLLNRLLRVGAVQRVAKAAAGIDERRSVPPFDTAAFRRWAARSSYAATPDPTAYDVVVWGDSFTDSFASPSGRAAIAVLEAAGLRVGVVPEAACCALTWVSTGQLGAARRILLHTLGVLHPYVERGIPVLGLEPSCTATLRSDAVELTDDPRALAVAGGVHTLAELLGGLESWEPPDLRGTTVVAQPHCHHASVLGWDADAALLARTGADVTRVGGCCGLAGNFGVEKGHYEVSVAVAEHDLLPAVRRALPGGEDREPGGGGAASPAARTVVLADGFSCRTQLADLADVHALHLAELLAEGGP